MILQQRSQRRKDLFPQVSMLFTLKQGKNHNLHDVCSLQHSVTNFNIKKRKTSFAHFKVKQQTFFWTSINRHGNLVHSTIVSRTFWESIGGKISSPMDHRVGTADGQSDGLQVLGVGEPWPIYLEKMEDCYIL